MTDIIGTERLAREQASEQNERRHQGAIAPLIELRAVEKRYRTGKLEFAALRGVDLFIGPGELVAVVGPSGSGKTTILNMITGIDRPTAGRVTVAGADLNSMSEERLARWRGETVGIVFQFFQLLPTLTALENVLLALELGGRGSLPRRAWRGAVPPQRPPDHWSGDQCL